MVCDVRRGYCVLVLGLWVTGWSAEVTAPAVEEVVALEASPAPVQATLAKSAADGTITRIRKVTEGTVVTYKADVEIGVDSSGRLLKQASPDPVLAKPVTVDLAAVRLQDVCKTLSQVGGVPVTCGGSFAEKPVTLALKDAPFGDVLKAVAQQTGTRAEPRDGGYRFRTGGR